MKTKKIIAAIAILGAMSFSYGQKEPLSDQVKEISIKIKKIAGSEKENLKKEILKIEKQRRENKISQVEAERLKAEATEKFAKEIEMKVAIEKDKINILLEGITKEEIVKSKNKVSFLECTTRMQKRDKRTTGDLFFAGGLNNVLIDHKVNSFSSSKYKQWPSHFYEVGLNIKTRLSKKPSHFYINYGLSFLWNNLRLENNQYHVLEQGETIIAAHVKDLSESRLRNVQVAVPMYLEYDFSKHKASKDGALKDTRGRSFRVGFGGFLGANIGTKQFLSYRNPDGVKVDELQKHNFNVQTFNYGLSAFIGYRNVSLYTKYDLNPLFESTNTRNISVGLKFKFGSIK